MIEEKQLGIPDHLFLRGKAPMTKEEIRVITIAKARLGSGMTVWDVGSGTGSITVESARMVSGGKVYAVERSAEGCRLIAQNCSRFGIVNVEVAEGEAPGILLELPPPDRVIVGGSGGRLEDILKVVRDRLISGGRLVINAVTLETLGSSLEFLSKGWESEVVQVSVSKSHPMGSSRLMKAYNPVYIITAWRSGV